MLRPLSFRNASSELYMVTDFCDHLWLSGAPCWSCCPCDLTPDKWFEDEEDEEGHNTSLYQPCECVFPLTAVMAKRKKTSPTLKWKHSKCWVLIQLDRESDDVRRQQLTMQISAIFETALLVESIWFAKSSNNARQASIALHFKHSNTASNES